MPALDAAGAPRAPSSVWNNSSARDGVEVEQRHGQGEEQSQKPLQHLGLNAGEEELCPAGRSSGPDWLRILSWLHALLFFCL